MYEKIIEVGIHVLLIVTPLLIGGVTESGAAILEIVTGGLLLVWFGRTLTSRHQKPQEAGLPRHTHRYDLQLTGMPGWIFIGLFILLGGMQLLPLPGFLVKWMSPQAYHLYAEAAATTESAFPALIPLSVCTHGTETEMLKLLAYLGVVFLLLNSIHSRRQIRRLIYTILAMGTLEAFYSLLQLQSPTPLVPIFSTPSWMYGSFVNKNHFAGYLEMVILLAFGVIFTRFEPGRSERRSPRDEAAPHTPYMKAGILLIIVLGMLSAHLASGSRGGMVSLTGGIFVFILLANKRRLLRRWLVIVLIVIPFVVVITILMTPDQFKSGLLKFTKPQFEPSFQIRWEIWRTQWHIFQDFPLCGSGVGTLSHLGERYRTYRDPVQLKYSESDIMRLLAETGSVGIILVIGAGSLYLYRTLSMWKRRQSRWEVAIVAGGVGALTTLLIHSIMDFNFYIPSNALLFSVIAGLSYITAHTSQGHIIKKQKFALSPGMFYGMILIGVVGVGLYLRSAVNTIRAITAYKNFTHIQTANLEPVTKTAIGYITRAIRYDSNHPGYAAALGKFWLQYEYGNGTRPADPKNFDQEGDGSAEYWLRRAILLDPANFQYYFDMAILTSHQGACTQAAIVDQSEKNDPCAVARYLLAALRNAPYYMDLRRKVGQWYYQYNRDAAAQLMRTMIAHDRKDRTFSSSTDLAFAKGLYDMQMDYESDQEIALVSRTEPVQCQNPEAFQYTLTAPEAEIVSDDGMPEWITRLVAETARVKKIFCLPETVEMYQSAAVKLFAKRVGNDSFTIRLSIDDQVLTFPAGTIPMIWRWHEIPVDISRLRGKAAVTLYIRANGASENGYLQIAGDQDTPTRYSMLNFQQTNDLSSEEGAQRGEYVIRFILKK